MRLPRVLLASVGALATVGTNVATIQSANAATNIYEAESPANTLSGAAAATACGPCLGGGMVGFTGDGAGSLQFNGVTATATGDATLTITYTGTTGRQARLSVNGGAPMSLDFAGTGPDASVGTLNATVPLNAGGNTLTFTNAGGLAPGFDAISVASGAAAAGAGGDDPTPAGGVTGGTPAGGATSGAATGNAASGAAAAGGGAPVAGGGAPAAGGNGAGTGGVGAGSAGAGSAGAGAVAVPGAVPVPGGDAGPTASQLLAATAGCQPVSTGSYENEGESGSVPVCAVKGAVVWTSGMSVDCDGQRSAQCNEDSDCCFAASTAFQGPDGQPLDSASLPYIVVPGVSGTWNYRDEGVQAGSVAAVVYHNQVAYAVVGDVGPAQMIGEGSYALAQSLGINPDPRVGGAGSGVTFIVFTGPGAVVQPIDSHAAAVSLGQRLARQLVDGG